MIAHLLDEHDTLTTPQIAAILFSSPATARARLYQLRTAGWVDAFTPTRARGRLATHWVPGPLAAAYTAHHNGRTPPTPRTLRHRTDAIAASPQLEHTDGANQFFVDLLAHARDHPATRLARWWAPARTAASTGRRVHPDGHGVWEEDGHQVGFWLEHDTGTETIGRLIDKIDPYRRLRRDGGPDHPLLFHLPGPARAADLHRRIAEHLAATPGSSLGIVVATATHADHPAGQVWTIVGQEPRRHRIADLPSQPGRPGPYHPGPPTPEQDPLHLLAITPDRPA